MSVKSWWRAAWAGMMLAGVWGVPNAQGTLLVDLRQEGTEAKQIVLTPADLNKPINIDVYVQVTGATGNPALETFSSLRGGFVSSGGIRGSIAAVAPIRTGPSVPEVPPPPGWPVGYPSWARSAIDADGDGDLDLGSPAEWNYFHASSGLYFDSAETGYAELPDGGVEIRVGRISFTPTSLSGSTAIQFKPYSVDGQIAAGAGLWTEDSFDIVRNGETGQILCSDFVIVPEPAGLSLLGLGVMALLRRARRPGITR
ncbi:MAG: PEP-CTERM sorting domain-containing protein [Bacillota bacterium]